MKKLISIIAFLLFFATSFHSYSISSPPPPASCSEIKNLLLEYENLIIKLYIKLKNNNHFFEDLEVVLKDDKFISWPIFSLEPNEGSEASSNRIFTEVEIYDSDGKPVPIEKLENIYIEILKNSYVDIEEYSFLLHQLRLEMKKLEKLESEKTLVIGELYNRFRAIITQLQLSMQIYPTSYTAHYYCEPTKEEKEIMAEEIEKKLQKLKTLFDKGLITEDEYIAQTKEPPLYVGEVGICIGTKEFPSCNYNPSKFILDELKIN